MSIKYNMYVCVFGNERTIFQLPYIMAKTSYIELRWCCCPSHTRPALSTFVYVYTPKSLYLPSKHCCSCICLSGYLCFSAISAIFNLQTYIWFPDLIIPWRIRGISRVYQYSLLACETSVCQPEQKLLNRNHDFQGATTTI